MKTLQFQLQGRPVYYIHNGVPKPPSVILLHGKNSTAKTWADVGTLDALAKAGHSAIALGMPTSLDIDLLPEAWLRECMDILKLKDAIMVSPSLSTEFIMPFIIKHGDRMKAWVSVANMELEKFENVFPTLEFPVMAIWGELDKYAPVKHAELLAKEVKNGDYKIIKGAMHSPFQSNPPEFNKALVGFVNKVFKK